MVRQRFSLRVATWLCATWCWAASAGGTLTVVCGAKVVREELGQDRDLPRVVIEREAGSWKALSGEAWTGANAREFYFTLESETKDSPPPSVRVVWPGVRISRVLGAAGAVTPTPDGVRFTLGRGRAPTSVGTSLVEGAVHMHLFHNWEVRRAGSYRGGPWPAVEIQAQLNYLFAAREMCRAMGFAAGDDPGFKGDIRLYGFESNFPNGHVDHPPHFHIMLGWPGWTGTQAGHFMLDGKGRVVKNVLMADHGTRRESATYGPDAVCRMRDPDGKVGFELIVLPGGNGVVMRRAEGQPEFRIGPASDAGSALDAVAVFRRETRTASWERLCRVRAEDDAATGRMEIWVTGPDGQGRAESLTYDVDTGSLRPAAAREPQPRRN